MSSTGLLVHFDNYFFTSLCESPLQLNETISGCHFYEADISITKVNGPIIFIQMKIYKQRCKTNRGQK